MPDPTDTGAALRDPVETLVQHLGAERTHSVLLDALCKRSTDPAVEPQAWLADDALLTRKQSLHLDALARRSEALAQIGDLDQASLARLVLAADSVVLGDDAERDLATWLRRGARLVSPHSVDLSPRGLLDETSDGHGGWVVTLLVATVHDEEGHEILWLTWTPSTQVVW